MTGYHTRWVRPPEHADDPERIAIREGSGPRQGRVRPALRPGSQRRRPGRPSWHDRWMRSSASKKAAPSPPSPCYGASPPLSTRTYG